MQFKNQLVFPLGAEINSQIPLKYIEKLCYNRKNILKKENEILNHGKYYSYHY